MPNVNFDSLVDNIRHLPLDEQIVMKDIIEKSIIEKKRRQIHKNAVNAEKAYRKHQLSFSDDINELKNSLLDLD